MPTSYRLIRFCWGRAVALAMLVSLAWLPVSATGQRQAEGLPAARADRAELSLRVAQRPYWRGGAWGGVSYHASTPAEGAYRGMADLVRSAGASNLMNSVAAQNLTAARSAELDNRVKYTDTYFQMRQMNKYYRDAERGPPPTNEDLFRRAAAAAPARLTSSELDPLTGSIQWPIVLQDDVYRASRDEIEDLFAHRAEAGGGIGARTHREIQQAVDKLLEDLRTRISEYAPSDYLAARTFLDSLRHETRFPTG